MITIIIRFLQSLFSVEPVEQEQEQGQGQRPDFPEREATEAAGNEWVEAVLDALQWPLTFLLLFRRHSRHRTCISEISPAVDA